MPRYHDEIINTLKLIGHGEMLDAFHEDLLTLEKAISETSKAGSISLKLKILPNGHNKRVIAWEVSKKVPTLPASNTYVFATQQGQYCENDPEQRELNLKVVPIDEKPQIKKVD